MFELILRYLQLFFSKLFIIRFLKSSLTKQFSQRKFLQQNEWKTGFKRDIWCLLVYVNFWSASANNTTIIEFNVGQFTTNVNNIKLGHDSSRCFELKLVLTIASSLVVKISLRWRYPISVSWYLKINCLNVRLLSQ